MCRSPRSQGERSDQERNTAMQTERYNLWGLVIFVTMSISLARGINFPNLWSYSHYVFTYDVGFTKRGLLGSVIGYLDFPYLMSYDFFFLFTFIIFLSNVFLLGWMLLDFVQSRNLLLIGCSMIFACSMGMVYLAHTIAMPTTSDC